MARKKEQPKIRSNYQPSEKEREKLEFVYRRFEDLKWARSNHAYGDLDTKWDEFDKRWEAYRKDIEKEDWQSDLYIPMTTAIIESQLAEVIDQAPMPVIEPVEPNDIVAAATISHLYRHSWRKAYSDVEHFKLLKDTFKYGTGIWQESFLDVPRKVKDLVKFDPIKGIEEYEEREIKDYYDVYGENVSIRDFFPDDKGRYFHPGPFSCRDAIRRFVMHVDDFREYFQGPIWDQLGNAKYVVAGGNTEYYEYFKPPQDIAGDDVEVIWYWSRYPDDVLCIVANDVLIKDGPNPYKHKELPFSQAVDYIRPSQFYAKGDAELLESIQDELNTLRRMRLDRAHLDLDKMFLVSSRESIDEEDLMARPHGSIEVDDPVNGIRELTVSPIARSAYLEEDRLKEDAIRISGIDDRFQAVSQGGTATETAIVRESTLRRIRMKMRMHERIFLPRIAKQRIANFQQFYTKPMAEAILGEEKSSEYKASVARAKAKNRFFMKDGKPFQNKYPMVPIKDKRLSLSADRSRLVEEDIEGWSFFEATPELIRGNVDVYFEAGSSISISKPLEQQRTEALLQHPLVQAAIQSGHYELPKVVDDLVKKHEMNPEQWKPRSIQQDEVFDLGKQIDPSQEIALAEEENKMLLQGLDVPPTPYITERHVAIHIAMIQSPVFAQAVNQTEAIMDNAMDHVVGEITLIKQRDQALGQTPMGGSQPGQAPDGAQSIGGPAPEGQQFPAAAIQPSPSQPTARDVNPGLIQGQANNVPGLPR
jgi:hypothetical protein